MLSAVRELVLDQPPPIGSKDQRNIALAKRFPELSSSEIADLAAIDPERVKVYTRLVFAGELSMLEWMFPMTLAAIQSCADQLSHDEKPCQPYDIVVDLHRKQPWHSSSSRELAANFQTYVREYRSDLAEVWAGFSDLIDFERCDVEVFYALDAASQPIEFEKLAALSVEQLMAMCVLKPSYIALREYQYDIVALSAHWREHEQWPIAFPPEAPCLVACGRSPESLMPSWVTLCEAEHATFSNIKSNETIDVNDIAQSYLSQVDTQGLPEQQLFQQFFDSLLRWFKAGLLLQTR